MGLLVMIGIAVQAYYGGALTDARQPIELSLSIFVVVVVRTEKITIVLIFFFILTKRLFVWLRRLFSTNEIGNSLKNIFCRAQHDANLVVLSIKIRKREGIKCKIND